MDLGLYINAGDRGFWVQGLGITTGSIEVYWVKSHLCVWLGLSNFQLTGGQQGMEEWSMGILVGDLS